jgi:hypothetical protein
MELWFPQAADEVNIARKPSSVAISSVHCWRLQCSMAAASCGRLSHMGLNHVEVGGERWVWRLIVKNG